MINVIEVYNALRDLANKDQKGFISPRVFNEFAGIAQSAVYEEMFRELADAKTLRMRNVDPSQHDSVYRGKQDDLHEYLEESFLTLSGDGLSQGEFFIEKRLTFNYPTDFARLIGLRIAPGRDSAQDAEPFEIPSGNIDLEYNPVRLKEALSSNLSAPTPSFPIALVAEKIELFGFDPDADDSEDLFLAIKKVLVMTYYRQPRSRAFINSTTSSGSGGLDKTSFPRIVTLEEGDDGFFIPNPSECRNFDLPEHYKSELIAEMAKMIGIRLRDPIISQYGTVETQTK
tara:strand:+ start:1446 stop:2303 length:858 start_codon:yes stop_codon:yes gene_type:complete